MSTHSDVYDSRKIFRFTDRMYAFRDKKIVAPVHIRIKPTNACNHSCWFCAYRVENLSLGEDMDLRDSIPADKMDEIVADVIAMKVQAVTFSGGGEPLLYGHIVPTVESLGRAGVKIASLTNGAFLRGKVAEVFAEFGTWVRISMDYWDAISMSESRRTRKRDFAIVMENIERFAARKSKCTLGVSFIITQNNSAHIYDFCNTMKELGVNHVKLSACVVSTDGIANNSYHAKFRSLVNHEISKCEKLNDEHFAVVNHYHEAGKRFVKEYQSCPILQFLTVIGADCRVYTCQDKAYTSGGLLGSIKDRSFRDFWFSEENQERVFSMDPSKVCNHHCVAHQKNISITKFLEIDEGHGAFV